MVEPGEARQAALLLEEDWAPSSDAASAPGSEVALASFQTLICDYLRFEESDEDRLEKMTRNLELQQSRIADVLGEQADPRQVVSDWWKPASREERTGILVEVFYLDPFSPNDIKHKNKHRERAFVLLDQMFGFDPSLTEVAETAKSASKAHRNRDWKKAGIIGIGAAALLAAGGFIAAPLIGAGLGAAAGLSGAAATAHGLAILGGGALAAGGAGVAGGMWLVAGVAGAAGLVADGGGATLYQLGAATATRELVKLQITFKLAVLQGQSHIVKAQEVIKRLNAELETTRTVLDEALLVNEANSKNIKDLQQTVTAVEEAINWMEEEQKKEKAA